MGQTLTHGVYLPDKGERNCYNGLAANWQLLDNSVGTIAEHTSALSGKAPLVHTHGNITNDGKVGTTANKPLITGTDGVVQAGSFGTAANTFCEGNDSRLSDARTPVAHTHGKADITDLFNSANTWSALNSYSNGQIRIKSQNQEIGVIPSSSVIQYLEFADKNDARHGIVGLWDYADGASEIQMHIADKFKNGVKDPTGTSESTFLSFGFKADGSKFLTFSGQVDNSVIPKSNNTYNLGTSTNKWKTLNGVNPGALSLPKTRYFNLDTTNWNLRGGAICSFTPSYDGFINVQIRRNVDFSVWSISSGRQNFRSSLQSNGSYIVMVWFPCRAGTLFEIYSIPLIDSPAEQREDDLIIQVAKLWPSEGNV